MNRVLVPIVVASTVAGCGGNEPRADGSAPSRNADERAGAPEAIAAESPAPESDAAPAPEAGSDPVAASPEGSVDDPSRVAAVVPSLPEGPAAPSPWPASVETTVTITGSDTLRIAAQIGPRSRPDGSRLWAQAVTDEGAPAGPAVELRTTNGEVVALAAAFDGATVWVGWQSSLTEDGRALQGLAGYGPALRQTVKTKNLRFHRTGPGYGDDSLQLVARPGVGAGVTVVALAGTVRCKGMFFEEEGMTDCVRLAVDLVGPDGTVELTETSDLDGGEPSFTITEGEEGLDVDFLAWHGGAVTDNVYVSYSAASERLSTCGFPPVLTAWIDGGLLSICPDPDLTDDEVELSCSPSNPGACGTFVFDRPAGATGTTSIPQDEEIHFERLTLGCASNVPTVRVSWKGRHFDMPADAMGFSGEGAVLEGGACKGTPLP